MHPTLDLAACISISRFSSLSSLPTSSQSIICTKPSIPTDRPQIVPPSLVPAGSRTNIRPHCLHAVHLAVTRDSHLARATWISISRWKGARRRQNPRTAMQLDSFNRERRASHSITARPCAKLGQTTSWIVRVPSHHPRARLIHYAVPRTTAPSFASSARVRPS